MPVDKQRQIDRLATRQQVLAEQVQVFVRAWFADGADLPVVDTVLQDEAGNILDEGESTTLFGTMSTADEEQLGHYEQEYVALAADVIRVLRSPEN